MITNCICGKETDLSSGQLRIRSMTEADLPQMLTWLSDDRVLAFYGGRDLRYTPDSIREHYSEPISSLYYRVMIEVDGVPIGYGQIYLLDDPMRDDYTYPSSVEKVFATDQFLGVPELWGHGIGTEYMRTILGFLRDNEHADVVLVDPHVDNARAIRAYEKAGFKQVSLLPEHELYEGRKKDCLLMEYRYPAG